MYQEKIPSDLQMESFVAFVKAVCSGLLKILIKKKETGSFYIQTRQKTVKVLFETV